ncbi:MAG: helix-turn-helix domain-containing protein [Pseudobutyrivibrio sp.]|nr:helix-turn-helix domain-containing protein [Pseudobutyrivibrio sp.]
MMDSSYSNIATQCIDTDTTEKDLMSLTELAKHLGVSKGKVTSTIIPMGIPYTKKGNAYVFDFNEVYAWEVEQRGYMYRTSYREFPAYKHYRVVLKKQLRQAIKEGDKLEIDRIRGLQDELGYRSDYKVLIMTTVSVGCFVIMATIMMLVYYLLY